MTNQTTEVAIIGGGISGAAAKAAAKFMPAMCRFYVDYDCELAEINPLAIVGDNRRSGVRNGSRDSSSVRTWLYFATSQVFLAMGLFLIAQP